MPLISLDKKTTSHTSGWLSYSSDGTKVKKSDTTFQTTDTFYISNDDVGTDTVSPTIFGEASETYESTTG